ncbi:hypothetical protein ZWY2020_022770 [Hordeum vulgare]|nr:hypothetical protein ZWY2020_022770 [Hordeum vulgare]
MQGDESEKKGKVKKGWLAVRVVGRRVLVVCHPIGYLCHPLFQRLLEATRDTYGYNCSVDEFIHLHAVVDRDN